jgi:hypothetical protein
LLAYHEQRNRCSFKGKHVHSLPANARCFVYEESVFSRSLHQSGLSLWGSGLRVFWGSVCWYGAGIWIFNIVNPFLLALTSAQLGMLWKGCQRQTGLPPIVRFHQHRKAPADSGRSPSLRSHVVCVSGQTQRRENCIPVLRILARWLQNGLPGA